MCLCFHRFFKTSQGLWMNDLEGNMKNWFKHTIQTWEISPSPQKRSNMSVLHHNNINSKKLYDCRPFLFYIVFYILNNVYLRPWIFLYIAHYSTFHFVSLYFMSYSFQDFPPSGRLKQSFKKCVFRLVYPSYFHMSYLFRYGKFESRP